MGIDLRGGDQADDPALGGEQGPEPGEKSDLPLQGRDVIERKCRQHEIVGTLLERAEVAVWDQAVIAPGIHLPGFPDHVRGDVHADGGEPDRLQEPRRASRAAPEIDGFSPLDMGRNDFGEIPIGQIIGAGVLQTGIGRGPLLILVDVLEIHQERFIFSGTHTVSPLS